MIQVLRHVNKPRSTFIILAFPMSQKRTFLIHQKTRKGQLYQWRRKTLFGIGSVKFLLSSFSTYRAVASCK